MKNLVILAIVLPVLDSSVAGQNDKVGLRVRQLTPPKGIFPLLGGGKKIVVLENAKDLEKLAGPKGAPQIAKQVDFEKEQILFVGWSTSGPPFGMLKFDVKAEGKNHVVEFYIQEPNAKVRGEALRIGTDYIAVPKGISGRFRK